MGQKAIPPPCRPIFNSPLLPLTSVPKHDHDIFSSQVSLYDLTGVICHHGSAGGGHYTAYALNPYDQVGARQRSSSFGQSFETAFRFLQEWYEFDDSTVTKVEPAVVANAEAYVLFYR